MKRILVLLALLAAPAFAELRPVTIDDLMKLRSIVDVKIAPDAEQVAYVVSTPSVEKNEHQVALYLVSARGGAARRLAESIKILDAPLPAPRLRWKPDGSAVSLLAIGGERPQIFAIPLSGDAPEQITKAPEGVFAYEWSPDGKSIAFLTRESPTPAETKRRAMVNRVHLPDKPARLAVQPLGGELRFVSPPAHYVDSFSWSPEGAELAYAAAPRSGFTAQYETRLYAVAQEGGDPRVVVGRKGMNSRPQWSPDGRSIAFISTGERFDIMAPRSLTVVASRGGTPRLYLLDDAWINEFVWASDSKSIYFQGNDGTFGQREKMFEQAIVRLSLADGAAVEVSRGASVNLHLSISRDGRRMAYRSIEGRTMGDLFVHDLPSGRATKLTDVNPELRELALGELRVVTWRSFDEMEIYGLLLTPPAMNEGVRMPMLVYVHGGPGGGVTHGLFPQFMHTVSQIDPYPTAAMASAGFAVLFPMPRGGAGYGEKGQRAIVNAWGEGDYRDIMAGVDAMIARGIADPERLGVMGASYGGYMTDWIVTQTSRFKAASSSASISDLEDVALIPDGGEIMGHYFKMPWENRESYLAHSPLTFVERVTTPLLIQHGERDPRAPVAGAWRFYRALKALGKTVELDIYPRGGHVMVEPMLQRDVMERNLEWFSRWLGSERR